MLLFDASSFCKLERDAESTTYFQSDPPTTHPCRSMRHPPLRPAGGAPHCFLLRGGVCINILLVIARSGGQPYSFLPFCLEGGLSPLLPSSSLVFPRERMEGRKDVCQSARLSPPPPLLSLSKGDGGKELCSRTTVYQTSSGKRMTTVAIVMTEHCKLFC